MQFVTSEDGWTSVVTAAAVDREIDQPAVLNAWAVGNGVAVAVAVGITVGVGDGAGVGVGSGPKVAIGIVGEGMVAIGEGTLVGGMTVCVTAATKSVLQLGVASGLVPVKVMRSLKALWLVMLLVSLQWKPPQWHQYLAERFGPIARRKPTQVERTKSLIKMSTS